MGIFQIVSGVLLFLAAGLIIVLVCMQEGKGGVGVLDGSGGDTSERTSRNHARTMTEMLRRATTVCGAILLVLTLAVTMITAHIK